jgi:hypothetical protein
MNVQFETHKEGKDEWLTPPYILKALGDFDLDPCSPINRPWDVAKNHYTYLDNGLMMPWEGRVFCNPPYGKETGKLMHKCAWHKNVTALIFARTDTSYWHDYIFKYAKSVLFMKGRTNFYHIDGTEGGRAGAPSALVAFDSTNTYHLIKANRTISGKLLILE